MSHNEGSGQGPTYDENERINERATRYLRAALEEGAWNLRRWDPDTFVDYDLELRRGTEPSGLTAYIQLKGQQKFNVKANHAVFQIETKAVKYWLNDCRRPVFVVRVNTTEQKGYYLFVQKWLKETPGLETKLKGKQKKVTVKVPLSASFDDQAGFKEALREADVYVRNLYPGTPASAIAAMEAKFRKDDPRLDVKVSATSAGTTFSITPKEDNVPLNLRLTGLTADQLKALTESVGFGTDYATSVVGVQVTGSAALDVLQKGSLAGQVEMKPVDPLSADVFLIPVGSSRGERLVLPSRATRGFDGIAVETADIPALLKLKFRMPKSSSVDGMGNVNFALDLKPWAGRRLIELPGFRRYTDFLMSLLDASDLRIEVSIGVATTPVRMTGQNPMLRALQPTAQWCEILRLSAEAALALGIDPAVPSPETFDDSDLANLARALDVVRHATSTSSFIDITPGGDCPIDFENLVGRTGTFRAVTPLVLNVLKAEVPYGHEEVAGTRATVTAHPKSSETFRLIRPDGGGFEVRRIRGAVPPSATISFEPEGVG